MNNAEKYLKENIDVEDFANRLTNYYKTKVKEDAFLTNVIYQATIDFLQKRNVPQITKTEIGLLKTINLEIYDNVGRDLENDLYFDDDDGNFTIFVTTLFGHLFQSINKGKKYKIKELLVNDQKK
jgi:hypothetical protein